MPGTVTSINGVADADMLARRGAIRETAQAAGVLEEDIVRAESEEPVPAETAEAIESLIAQLG
jgi:hypothetical protein